MLSLLVLGEEARQLLRLGATTSPCEVLGRGGVRYMDEGSGR